MRLDKKVVIVTASTRGIGLAITKTCVKEGAIVYMAARNLEKAQDIILGLKKEGYTANCVYNDADRQETYQNMIDEVYAAQGKIDVLVNNFGTSDPRKDKDIETTDFDEFMNTLNANLGSVYLASQAVIPYMKKNGGGSIINISSIAGLIPDISQISYGTSKAGINHLTKLIAVMEAKNNIRCNAVLPGMTATDAVKDNLSDDFREFFLKHTPIKRMGTPEEIAAAVLYFASDDSAYTTGQIMDISGGFGLPTPIYGDMIQLESKR